MTSYQRNKVWHNKQSTLIIYNNSTLQQINYMLPLIIIAAALVFLVLFIFSIKPKKPAQVQPQIIVQIQKPNYGHLQVFYGSQTGVAAKMAQSFTQQAIQKGFDAQVIDLKNISFDHLNVENQISVFFLSNTGQGQPPQNSVKFMKVLKQKQDLHQQKVIPWNKVSYLIFGLGNTQYQFYNKTGIDADSLLQKRGAKRVFKLGLGDNNASLQDDYIEWKNQVWDVLIKYRLANPLLQIIPRKANNADSTKLIKDLPNNRKYISQFASQFANFKLFYCNKQQQKTQLNEDQLDFKTKGSLKSSWSKVDRIIETRQNTKDGSTLQVQIILQNQPQYQTAGNIAIYPQNDPRLVKQLFHYFNISEQMQKSYVSIQKISPQKKIKLNFLPYCKLQTIFTQFIDLQSRLTKSVLKKLNKLKSSDPEYFKVNSSPKTTEQFKRITQNTNNPQNWYYLLRLISQYDVQITLEDFIQLSDSIAPRLFTIASSYKAQKNVIVSASIIDNGLVSKFLQIQPKTLKAELRKSTFTNAMKWKKVIFISAGTGFAPFRGYLQQKQLLMQHKKQCSQDCLQVEYPQISLYFGCKHSNGDFIYKQQIKKWIDTKVINKFYGAFSRDTHKKVYVQHLLEDQAEEVKQFLNNENMAIYICGSVSMGHDVSQVLAKGAGGHQALKRLQEKGRIIKQLW